MVVSGACAAAFEVPGQMIEFPVNEGDEVAKGAVLGRFDARDYEARLDSARAVLRKAQGSRFDGHRAGEGLVARALVVAAVVGRSPSFGV